MSDEIDLDQSHLCTTEDAFEKFQAVSMYEEDEYISLSDIVPAQAEAPDFRAELNEIPYENEVVLNTLEDQVPEVNSTIEISAEENQLVEPTSPATEHHGTANELPTSATNDIRSSKRGRKKKTTQDQDLATATEKSEIPNGTANLNSQDSEAIPTALSTQRRRGRRPKNFSQMPENNVTAALPVESSEIPIESSELKTETSEMATDVPKRTNRGRRPNKFLSQNKIGINENSTFKRAPGRQNKQKQPITDQKHVKDESLSEYDQQEITMNKTQDIIMNKTEESSDNKQVPKKRGRKKKAVPEEDSVSANEDNKQLNDTIDLLVEKHVNEPHLAPVKKSPGKRGRPKKIHTEEKNASATQKVEVSSTDVPNAEDEDGDDICLSQLKSTLEDSKETCEEKSSESQHHSKCDERNSYDTKTELEETPMEIADNVTQTAEESAVKNTTESIAVKRNSKPIVMEDFEYNIDSIMDEKKEDTVKLENEEAGNNSVETNDSLLVEDTSKRPVRRKTKQLHYEEESDEDPFANIELSDEDDMRGRKGRYYSDDEYIPGVVKKRGSKHVQVSAESDTSDSDIDQVDEEIMHIKRKRSKKLDSSPFKKRGRKSKEEHPEVSTIKPDKKSLGEDDVEICLETSIIKTTDETKKGWAASKEFENFLAKKIQGTDIKIKKASAPVQPLEIPVIDPNEAKKTIDISTQTAVVPTTSTGVQTTTTHDIPMKDNVPLTPEQSEKACEFLNNIVKTTAELGELMTQKSEDFIKKKINTNHVTDTFKMDYCVRKSFLLFKLAKHNLMQMEEDLAQQYETFLKTHDLSQHRAKPKILEAEKKANDSDSDCEIIETLPPQKPKKVVPFNPKTVFLNKELSIKIAKKPTDDKKLNIKGRHTVWINDSVMVKKVKPTQSFLAQDSRNKKPPDCVTLEMVNSFFDNYYRQEALAICAPYVASEWLSQERMYVCSYFFANTDDFPPNAVIPSGSGPCEDAANDISTSGLNGNICSIHVQDKKSDPKTLFSLCTRVLQVHLQHIRQCCSDTSSLRNIIPMQIGNQSPVTLRRLCVDSINMNISIKKKSLQDVNYATPAPLKTLCYQSIAGLLYTNDKPVVDCTSYSSLCRFTNESVIDSRPYTPMWEYDEELLEEDSLKNEIKTPGPIFRENKVMSLFSLCIDLINTRINCRKENKETFDEISKLIHKPNLIHNLQCPESLKATAFEFVKKLMYTDDSKCCDMSEKYTSTNTRMKVKTLADICFQIVSQAFSDSNNQTLQDGLTINAVNTLTEEAYHNLDQSELSENADDYYADDDSNFYDDETESGMNNTEDASLMADNWLSQVKMKISSCYDPNVFKQTVPENPMTNSVNSSINTEPIVTRIKLEPIEDESEILDAIDTSIVKSEPMPHLDEMTIIPEGVVTKSEFSDPSTTTIPETVQRQNSSSFDVDQFEAFVSTNKMIHNMNRYDNEDEVFSQSAARIRRQYEPDSDTENDTSMSLLVPQTYEPVPFLEKNKVKDSLMESSSDESNINKKLPTKKKPERRARRRPKKNESKAANNKDMNKEKPNVISEVAMLTRRMRDKIRQEEKKVASSDSEPETEKDLSRKGKEKLKETNSKLKEKGLKSDETNDMEKDNAPEIVKPKPIDNEIQCSNVDSTEQLNDSFSADSRNASPNVKNFSGFTAVDQNEISSYQKYVKYVYDQISNEQESTSQDVMQSLTNPEQPVEMLECEPTMPFLMDETLIPSKFVKRKGRLSKQEEKKANIITSEQLQDKENNGSVVDDKLQEESKLQEENKLYIDRYGWKCYPLDGNDTKLYQNAQILLEKLPESFVETYFRYQDLTHKNDEDDEVDRLTNLQTLNKSSVKDGAVERKCKGKPKCKIQPQVKNAVYSILGLEQDADSGSRPLSPTNSEHYDEFTPSEEEGEKVNEESPPPVAKPPTENNLAKNSLMDDNDSEGETKIKKEPKEPYAETSADVKPGKKYKPGPKCMKMKKQQEEAAPVMLTADKMMNKELNLLHAPVVIDESDTKIKTPSKGPVTRNKQKSATKTSPKDRIKCEDDSSSEEEKQWFTIKEKLLKRMVKKNDTTREDDAKRAKLVSEFIEKRGDGTESYIKKRGRAVRGRRSKKKLLERQKQLRVLTRELFGDPSNDASLQRKKQAGAYFKGRRNIRKVLDKKSLAKSTVVANMEEFERKRRLNIRQSKLREVLRCEEGVNVLVINDEVCLEYDFEQHRPVVTIHPFFTKVMKAHQYEGVKFMWDACFESLGNIAEGHPGSGCILAHCMGLGKTLQVLALLHTVLTHPGVKMQRVLVCCPLSTVLNWVDEIHKWIGPVTDQIKVFELSKLRKTYERAYQLEDWYSGGGIFIIGYELFRSLTTLDPNLDDVRPTIVNKIRTALLDPGPDIIICDEGHLLKNDCSVLAVAMSRVATHRRIVLTGTPMQNNLREYYCMVNFVKPNLLGTYAEFSNRFENPIMNGQHRDSREEDIKLMKARTHILHKVLEGCLQRQEASVLYPYLPKKHEYTVFISLTKCQWDLYKHYLSNYGNTQNNKSILKDFHILQKIWSHPQVLHNFQMRVCDEAKAKIKVKDEKLEDDLAHEDLNETADVKPSDTEVWWLQYLEGGSMLDSLTSSNKFVAVFRILDESVALGDKVLIFSTSLFTMDTLEFFLKKKNKWSLGQEYYRLDGSVPAEVRQKWCREFNAENNLKTKLFLISTRAGSLGLNMTAANRVIILDTSWNPAHDIQSIFRVYRFGQKKDCYIYRLVALGTMEQKIYERSVTKQAVACRVVDEQQIDRHYNMADLTELYKYDEAGVGVAGGVAVGVQDVVLLRVARDAALHAAHEHDSLLRGSGEQGLPEHERDAAWVQFQEEHAHKQMQQDALQKALLNNPPPKKRKYAKLKLAIKHEPAEAAPQEAAPAPRLRGRKPKTKNSVVSCCIPIQPDVADLPDPDKEHSMVKKISDILLQHNFQNHKTPNEIQDLADRVRQIVASGRIDLLDSTDELTMKIASVFLQKDEPPGLTDIVPEEPGPSVANDVQPEKPSKPKGRKKGSGKKFVFYEEIPSTSAEQPKAPVPDVEGSRTRRRAALAAERNFDAITDSVIDIEDEDWQNEDVYTPSVEEIQRDEVEPNKPVDVPNRKSSKKMIKERAAPKESEPARIDTPLEPVPIQDDSIMLSDDDEPLPLLPSRKSTRKRQTKDVQVEQAVESKKGDTIPLHPTLLSNKNFIKIVAHTYLSGNPMLDEDAATLAAQYSTYKALKEYELTKKQIENGPIYDIAVKVLGIDVLKKLHSSNAIVNTSEIVASHPINSKGSPVEEVAATAPVKVEERRPVKVKIKIPPLPASLPAAGKPPPPGTPVVPVGLYKRAEEGPSSTADECILPDDDDIRIISDPTPPCPLPTPPPTPAPPPVITLGRRNAKRMLVTKVKSDKATPAPPPTQQQVAPSYTKPIIIPASSLAHIVPSNQFVVTSAAPTLPVYHAPVPSAPVRCESILSDLNTISLDSDDEESIVPHSTPTYAVPQTSQPMLTVDSGDISVMSLNPTKTQPPAASTVRPIPFNQINPSPVVRNYLRKVAIPLNSTVGNLSSVPKVVQERNTNTPGSIASPQQVLGTNYVIIPTSSLAQNTAVPVALSKIQLNAQGEPQLTMIPQEHIPVPAQPPPEPVPPPPPQTPPAVQPPTKPQLPASNIPERSNKRVCKPGDILRITESGKIEVLKRKDVPESSTSKSSKLVVESTQAKRATSTATTQPKVYKHVNNIRKSSSNKDDPLSILRDVVHIEADDYGSNEVQAPTKTKPAPKATTSKTQDKITILNSHNSKQRSEKTVDKYRKVETVSRDPKKAVPDQSKSSKAKECFVESVDLTDIDVSSSSLAPASTKPKALKGATTIVGTSKSIILCGSGKAVAKVDSGAEKREYSAKTTEKASSSSKNKVEVKKRAAAVDVSATKKKKTDKPMTLKDFNIDDIDDIIELD